jgi:hypothetical protein
MICRTLACARLITDSRARSRAAAFHASARAEPSCGSMASQLAAEGSDELSPWRMHTDDVLAAAHGLLASCTLLELPSRSDMAATWKNL